MPECEVGEMTDMMKCVFCPEERAYPHYELSTGDLWVFCDHCGGRSGAHKTVEEAVAEWERVLKLREALELAINWYPNDYCDNKECEYCNWHRLAQAALKEGDK